MTAFVKVRLISPLMQGGANGKFDKSSILRPPQVRGQLRFWTRAMAAGAGLDCRGEESSLWGNQKTGQRTALLPPFEVEGVFRNLKLFPHKSGGAAVTTNMLVSTADPITLRFRLSSEATFESGKLAAIVWLWLHLGSLGKRARRGYGSLLWMRDSNDFLAPYFNLDQAADLSSATALADMLRRGLRTVQQIWGAPNCQPRRTEPFFTLRTTDQIFVGQELASAGGQLLTSFDNSTAGLQHRIHGIATTVDPGFSIREELGHAGKVSWFPGKGRHASPMLWRLFPCGHGFVPVMTWSPWNSASVPAGTQVHDYLTSKMGFNVSLAGNSL